MVMRAQLNNAEQEFLRIVQRLQPVGIQDLIEATGVTATAVRHRLGRLQELGLIDRVSVKQDRGRPSHQYQLTNSGIRVLGDETPDLAALLWNQIQAIEDPRTRAQLLNNVKSAMVQRMGSVAANQELPKRVQDLCDSLETRGLMVESGIAGELPVIREHSCPYHAVAQVDTGICELEKEAFAEVLGAPVQLSNCRLDGHRCCEFQVGVPS
jgi:predicted ArsR family transcriptional regulator